MIMFVSDNGWLQGEHRIPGDKFLPYEESLRVPLIIRGPGVPKGQTVHGQVSNIDFAPTLLDLANAKAGRTMDGVSLLPTIRNPKRRPNRALEIEALAPLFAGDDPDQRLGPPLHGVRTDRYTYVVWTETGEQELYDREVRSVPARERRRRSRLRDDRGAPGREAGQARRTAEGDACNVKP